MDDIFLSDYDQCLLSGSEGKAKQIAMRIMLKMARLQGAERFIDVSSAHIDGCIYLGESSVLFPSVLADAGGKVTVPTTMNAISIDRKRWKRFNIDEEFANAADRVAFEYERMGAQPTFSCTPYQLPNAPKFGEQIAWAESNAVVFANSVIGARTNRYGDFMDICAALTGRVPLSGYHKDEERLGTVLIRIPDLGQIDDSFYPLLGLLIGDRIGKGVPVIEGLPEKPTEDNLKAFGAAIATTGAVGMYHMVGITPEAPTVDEAFGFTSPTKVWDITKEEFVEFRKVVMDNANKISLVLLGSPQFSLDECKHFAELVSNKHCHPDVRVIITTNRYVYENALNLGIIDKIKQFGAEILTDTCLCMIEPFIRNSIQNKSENILTNSGKFTHYGPGLTGSNGVFLGSIYDCVDSAVTGVAKFPTSTWLNQN